MSLSIYITDAAFEWTLADLDYQECNDVKKQEILFRAVADFEADMASKYVVPLTDALNVAYNSAPLFARNKVLSAMKDKIREIIGYDKNRNLAGTVESTEKFLNVHGDNYKAHVKKLLDPKVDFGFLLLEQAQDAQTPVQHLGLARPKDRTDPFGGGGSFY